ncbi:MAG: PLP-dependent transferase [Cytophagaceae bacterium]
MMNKKIISQIYDGQLYDRYDLDVRLKQYDVHQEVNKAEKIIAYLESGSDAMITKSFKQARFSLFNSLRKEGLKNLLSFSSKNHWKEDSNALQKIGYTFFFPEPSVDEYLSAYIVQNKIDIIYLESINESNLKVLDFRFIIHIAKIHNVLVVVNNTQGGFGNLFNPINKGADFVIADLKDVKPLFDINVGGYVVENVITQIKSKVEDIITGNTLLGSIKSKRVIEPRKRLVRVTSGRESLDEIILDVSSKYIKYSHVADTLTDWLSCHDLIMDVTYPGRKSSLDYENTSSCFKNNFGAILKFKLWDQDYGYAILNGYMASQKPSGIIIRSDVSQKEITVIVRSVNVTDVLAYFKKLIDLLRKDLEYRHQLSLQQNEVKVWDKLRQLSLRELVVPPYKYIH